MQPVPGRVQTNFADLMDACAFHMFLHEGLRNDVTEFNYDPTGESNLIRFDGSNKLNGYQVEYGSIPLCGPALRHSGVSTV